MTAISAAGFASQAYAALLQPAGRAAAEGNTGRATGVMDTDTRGGDSNRAVDFSHATPQQMQAVAAQMFSTGRINLAELGMLQRIGLPPLSLDENGGRLPLDATERARHEATPLDYRATVADRVLEVQQSGVMTSTYGNWLHLQSVLQGGAAGTGINA